MAKKPTRKAAKKPVGKKTTPKKPALTKRKAATKKKSAKSKSVAKKPKKINNSAKKKATTKAKRAKKPATNKKTLRTNRRPSMATKKTIFVAFSMADKFARDSLKGQSLNTRSPFEFVDMSVKTPYPTNEWKQKVRTRIRRSNGVIAFVSRNSLSSTGQKFEIQCAKEERVPLLGLWAYQGDRTNIVGVNTKVWTWDNIVAFIDRI